MLKIYRISVVVLCLFAYSAMAQNNANYKDVLLDGKPARLNLVTGEIVLKDVKDAGISDTLRVLRPEIKDGQSVLNALNTNALVSENQKFHIVKEGERLSDISQRYNISLNRLRALNSLETTLIEENQVLRISDFSDDNLIEKNESSSVQQKGNLTYHTISKGETLYSLSKRFGIEVEDLKRINNLNSNIIKVGQKLSIDKNAIKTFKSPSVWTVSRGDTLFSIARRNNTKIADLKRLNNLTSDLIKEGQILKLK
ncbi:LysM peptidoglycan-binding domain-containing protein [Winogradskyella ursingii]|uniref:LysM peptidoglycan-binding domain-containing protein n=1 Tax=Winogradskyella ursingii TaxID=2686079 RepID=UPI0015C9291B|nr:LysM peptidoglycan-binding domain-containing protein [Winogradskyella ursingii]